MAFARDVGELQSLSGVDLKLIALTHTLERAAYGDTHLRSTAPTPKVHAKMHKSPGKLPGWGTEGADWDALDKEPEDQTIGNYSTTVHLLGTRLCTCRVGAARIGSIMMSFLTSL